MLLSGGVDSSLISTITSKVSNKKINTFTIGFHDKKYDESSNAQKVAMHLNTNHENYRFLRMTILEYSIFGKFRNRSRFFPQNTKFLLL